MTPSAISQLEVILKQLIADHVALLRCVEEHEGALRSCKIDRIEKAVREQDAARQRIMATESRRRVAMHQLSRQHRAVSAPFTLAKLAELHPDRAIILLTLRKDLTDVITRTQERQTLVARVAQAVLGHVNATLRLVAQAAAGPGTYTRNGNAPMPMRMGVLNAVA